MTKLDPTVIEEIEKYDWYQTIPLADDFSTPGETRDASLNRLKMMHLPEDLSGKSALDIGCNEGFFAFEAERRHADRVVAVDKSQLAVEKFNLVKRILRSKVEFLSKDLLELRVEDIGRFDIVFFMSVLHHLRYPLLALDRVYELTEGFAVMEIVEAVPVGPDQSALVRKMSKKGHLHMLPTRTFLLEVLERAGFSKIKILGTHRSHKLGSERKAPGFSEQRVLLKAFR